MWQWGRNMTLLLGHLPLEAGLVSLVSVGVARCTWHMWTVCGLSLGR